MSLAKVVEFQSQPGFWGGAWFIFLMPVSAFIFLVSLFAETNRQPFDMAEVRGRSRRRFPHRIRRVQVVALLRRGVFAHDRSAPACSRCSSSAAGIRCRGCRSPTSSAGCPRDRSPFRIPLVVGLLSIAIFLGKVLFLIFFFMWVRWTVPRFRYDQVMELGWQKLLPLAIANLIVYAIAIAVIQK